MSLKLMYITNNLEVALIAQKYGVDRVWVDLETIGKEDRQNGLDTVQSSHSVEDIATIKPHLTTSEMLVRVNKWHKNSQSEIDAVINAGADIIMLPYWKTVDEVRNFVKAVHGRCKTTLLLETKEAVDIVDDVLAMGGFDEIHIGLNDLHLSYGMTFMFELLADGTVEYLCRKFRNAGIPYGFGGIAKPGDGMLPAEKVIMEHYRLGSTRAILSRTFCDNTKIKSLEEIEKTFEKNMRSLREYENTMPGKIPEEYAWNQAEVCSIVNKVVTTLKRTEGYRSRLMIG